MNKEDLEKAIKEMMKLRQVKARIDPDGETRIELTEETKDFLKHHPIDKDEQIKMQTEMIKNMLMARDLTVDICKTLQLMTEAKDKRLTRQINKAWKYLFEALGE